LLEELKDLSRKNNETTIEKEQALDKLFVAEKEVGVVAVYSLVLEKRC
jgi:hypothetical protein